jgi:hypothetical protein
MYTISCNVQCETGPLKPHGYFTSPHIRKLLRTTAGRNEVGWAPMAQYFLLNLMKSDLNKKLLMGKRQTYK